MDKHHTILLLVGLFIYSFFNSNLIIYEKVVLPNHFSNIGDCSFMRLCTPYRDEVECINIPTEHDLYGYFNVDVNSMTATQNNYTYKMVCMP